jgi:hypothetical protein
VSRGGQRIRVRTGGERGGAEQEGGRGRDRTDAATLAIVPADSLYRSHSLVTPRFVPACGAAVPVSDFALGEAYVGLFWSDRPSIVLRRGDPIPAAQIRCR